MEKLNCIFSYLAGDRRYELGNFSRNIQKWTAFNEKGEQLPYQKVTKDQWKVDTLGAKSVTITYNYYANQLDAVCLFR